MHFTPAFCYHLVAREVKQENKPPLKNKRTEWCAASMFAMHPSMSIRVGGYPDF